MSADWEIVPLFDAEGSFATIADAFPTLAGEALEHARAAWPECFRGDDWWLPFHAFLLRGASLVVVDAGLGPSPRDFLAEVETHLPAELDRIGVDPADVEALVFTHLHVDHVGWAQLFTSAHAFVHRADREYFDRPATRAKLAPFEAGGRLTLLDGDCEIAAGLRAVETPGHTPGHMSLELDGAFVLGDVAVHPAQFADPGLVFRVGDTDHDLASATRRATLGRLADAGTRVASPHLPGVFGRVEREGDAFAWRPTRQP